MDKYTTDTYRDGGTISIKEDGDEIYCINKMLSDVEIGAVHPGYPTKVPPISGMDELLEAQRILVAAMPSFRAPNEVIMIGHGLGWLQTEIYKLKDAEKCQ